MSFEQNFSNLIAAQYSSFIKPVAEYVISHPDHSKEVNNFVEELRKAINLPEVAIPAVAPIATKKITVAPPSIMGSLPIPTASTPTDSPNKRTRGKKKEEATPQVFCDYEKYDEMIKSSAFICAYAPTSGEKKGKVCAAVINNEDEKAKSVYDRRCTSCKDKIGNITKLAGAKSNTTGVVPKTSDLPNIGNLNLPANLANILPGLGSIMNKAVAAPVAPPAPVVPVATTTLPDIPNIPVAPVETTTLPDIPAVSTIKPPTPLPVPVPIVKPTSPAPEPLQLKRNTVLDANKHYLAANPIPQVKSIVFHYDPASGNPVYAIGKLPYDVDGTIPSTYECDMIELDSDEQKIVSRLRATYKYTVKTKEPVVPVVPTIAAISPPKLPAPSPSLPGLPSIPSLPSIPGLPAIPGLPSIPGLPTIPGLPSLN